jgi:pyruvate/oxaloacetate carboxyltransferase
LQLSVDILIILSGVAGFAVGASSFAYSQLKRALEALDKTKEKHISDIEFYNQNYRDVNMKYEEIHNRIENIDMFIRSIQIPKVGKFGAS